MTADGRARAGADVALRQVTVTYTAGPPWARHRHDAVREVDLQLEPGTTLGLVGESGSGKSTLGRVILGLQRPTSGLASIDGRPYGKDVHRGGRVQAVLQHPEWALNPFLRVATSVAEPLAVCREVPRQRRRYNVDAALEMVGLAAAHGDRFPHELSGGQRQRAAIARAIVTKPRLIVFDEAVSALDVSAQAQALNLIRDVQREQGFSSLFISHDLPAVRYVADSIAVLFRGELLLVADAAAFYGRPRHPYVPALLGNGRDSGDGREPGPEHPPPASALASTRVDMEVAVEGCAYREDCPFADDRCASERPVLRLVAGQQTACHHAELLGDDANVTNGTTVRGEST